MFLHLRWYDIDVRPYRKRTITVRLPKSDLEYLELVKKKYGVPYIEFLKWALMDLKRFICGSYVRYMRIEAGDENSPPVVRVSITEQLDVEWRLALEDRKFNYHPFIGHVAQQSKKQRLCLRIAFADLEFLKNISKPGVTLSDSLSYVIGRVKGSKTEEWSQGYKPHLKRTFGIPIEDYRIMEEAIREYRLKYSEKLSTSEIVALAYHILKKMSGLEQVNVSRLERAGRSTRGNLKKISVSIASSGFAYEKRPEPTRSNLRLALYSLLRNEKFRSLVGL